ncbi:carbohydrate ABC transporter permease [Neobacillus niacini]|uniref:carbohydrate ABC transporter permease n=1 Tax=Neobacillus niacini TaxID=86668 RepID=UPI00300217BF
MKNNSLNQYIVHTIFILATIAALLPFLLMLAASLTDENALIKNGYSFFPEDFSLAAYAYLFDRSAEFLRAYGITIFVTAVGTFTGLLISSMLAYPLSRADLPFKGLISFLVFFTLLFNGGLVPFYLLYTEIIPIKNTIWALLLPNLLTNGFFILLMRSFFKTSIPTEVIESAYLDGANELKIYFKIVLPLSLPILATIGLMTAITYWNDWYNGLLFLTDTSLYGIQNVLYRILSDVQYLQQNDLSGQASSASVVPLVSVRMAIAVIGVLPLICAYPFFQKYLVSGLTLGAVKG